MNARQSRILHGLAALTLLLLAAHPATLQAQSCAGRTPAFAVTSNLWLPGIFRPGETGLPNNQIPNERDSTDWDSRSFPGFHSSHEQFSSVDVEGNFLYVGYNAGFSIWNIAGTNAETPVRVQVRDGWNRSQCQNSPICTGFLSFPEGGEVDFLTEDIDVLRPQSGGSFVYVALSGKAPVGMSLWRYNTATGFLDDVYQDATRSSRMVRLVEVGSTIYAFSSYSDGLNVYDFSAALGFLPGGCLEEPGAPVTCPGVDLGNLGTIIDGRYLDVLQRPTGEIVVATTDGNAGSQRLELWSLTNPASPGAAVQMFDGLDLRTFGVALFNYESNDYLAALEFDSPQNVIKIFNVNGCSGSTCSLGAPVFDDVGVPARVSDQFLTFSLSGTTPYLYYGLFGSLFGPKIEQLLDLTTLGRPTQNITEITDGGPTYFDNCQNQNLDYWPWYYVGNEFGFDNFQPKIGKFKGNYFYRAAGGILDVHVKPGGQKRITVEVADPDPLDLYWMGEGITFEGTGGFGCNPAGTWNWTSTSPPEIDAVLVGQAGNQVTYRFDCLASSGRCDDADVSVSGTNNDSSCDGAVVTPALETVKDPTLEIVSITPASGTFTQCEIVTFAADLLGRGPTSFAWSVNDVDDTTGAVNEEDLSTAMLTFDWDTARVPTDRIFSDGFESGDTTAWSVSTASRASSRGSSLPVDIGLTLAGGTSSDSVTVDLVPVAGDPAFGSPEIESTTIDYATFDFHANILVGTVTDWSWELEDDNGEDLCTFGMDDDVPCTLETGQDISHTWMLQVGERRVDLTISNCATTPTAEASTTVMVESLEDLEVTLFELDRSQSGGACDINFDCISTLTCVCHVDETIFFDVGAMGEPDFFDFDWDGNGSFEDAGHPGTTTEVTRVFTSAIGLVTPKARARRGASTEAQRDLKETLDIQP